VKPGKFFLYFDPIDTLPLAAQLRWQSAALGEEMIAEALARAGGRIETLA
jgi:hypothetical protein